MSVDPTRPPAKSLNKCDTNRWNCISNHVRLVLIDGESEGGSALTAEGRVSGKNYDERAQQEVSHRTCVSQPRLLSLKSTAGKFQRDHDGQTESRGFLRTGNETGCLGTSGTAKADAAIGRAGRSCIVMVPPVAMVNTSSRRAVSNDTMQPSAKAPVEM